MSTSGLIVVRELGPLSFARQLKTGALLAPGRSGPMATATTMASAANPKPRPTSALLPGPLRPVSQFAVSSRRAILMKRTNSSTLARYRADRLARLGLYERTEPNRNMVDDGM